MRGKAPAADPTAGTIQAANIGSERGLEQTATATVFAPTYSND
jgi:hypothetical protein